MCVGLVAHSFSFAFKDFLTTFSQANFREKSLFAMIKAEELLDKHDSCAIWRKAVKPCLKDRVRDCHGQLTILLVKKDSAYLGPVRLCVQDVFESVLAKINQYWNVINSHGSMYDDEVEDRDMADEMDDEDSSCGSEPVHCCKTHLQEWRNVAVTKLSEVEF